MSICDGVCNSSQGCVHCSVAKEKLFRQICVLTSANNDHHHIIGNAAYKNPIFLD